jgi:hypothetical protein
MATENGKGPLRIFGQSLGHPALIDKILSDECKV